MKTIHAIYEDGVFKPTEPVDLPEHCKVRFDPIQDDDGSPSNSFDHLERYRGLLKDLNVDPVEFQRSLRDEWD